MQKTSACIISLLISISLINFTNSATCASAKYLSECTGTDTGNQCYYKYYLSAANTCTVRTKTINNCIGYWYSYNNPTAVEADAKCKMCVLGRYAIVDETQTTTAKKYRCKTGDNGIANCMYPGTYIKADGTVIRYCNACQENYYGQNYNAFVGAATSCTQSQSKANPVMNCEYNALTAWDTNVCWACKKGYVANSAGTSCLVSTDEKCRQLASDLTCASCWWPYWFQGATCAGAFKIALGGLAALLVTIVVQVM